MNMVLEQRLITSTDPKMKLIALNRLRTFTSDMRMRLYYAEEIAKLNKVKGK